MKILVKYPSRSRPDQFKHRLAQMVDKADDLNGLYFVFTLDADDPTMANPEIQAWIQATGLNGAIYYDTSRSKIAAVNRDMDKVTEEWDILLLMSDDMECQQQGWDTTVREGLNTTEPRLLWHFDGYQRDISTMPIMNRAAYALDHYIYHPSYFSTHCDNEATDVARQRRILVYDERVLFRHAHCAWDASVRGDELHKKNELAYFRDQRNYEKRKAQGFPQ